MFHFSFFLVRFLFLSRRDAIDSLSASSFLSFRTFLRFDRLLHLPLFGHASKHSSFPHSRYCLCVSPSIFADVSRRRSSLPFIRSTFPSGVSASYAFMCSLCSCPLICSSPIRLLRIASKATHDRPIQGYISVFRISLPYRILLKSSLFSFSLCLGIVHGVSISFCGRLNVVCERLEF